MHAKTERNWDAFVRDAAVCGVLQPRRIGSLADGRILVEGKSINGMPSRTLWRPGKTRALWQCETPQGWPEWLSGRERGT